MSRVRSVLIGLLVVILALGALVLGSSPGSSQVAEPTFQSDAPAAPDAPPLKVRLLTSFVGPVGSFRAEVELRGLPADTTISFSLRPQVFDRTMLTRSITTTSGGGSAGNLLEGTAAVTDDGSGTSIAVIEVPVVDRWPAPDDGVVLNGSGVYPFVIEARGPAGDSRARVVTQLIRLPDPDTTTPPLAIGLIFEHHATPSIALDGSPYLEKPISGRLLDTLRIVARFPGIALTTLPSASTLIGAEAAGATSDTFAALRPSPTRQMLAASYAPIALDAWQASGLTDEIDEQFDAGRSALSRLIGIQPDSSIAMLDPTVDADGLDLLYGNGATSVIVPSDRLLPAIDPATTAAPTRGFDLRSRSGQRLNALTSDPAITAALAVESDPWAAAQRALAELSLIATANRLPAQGLAVIVPSDASPDTVGALLTGLTYRDGTSAGGAGAPLLSPVLLDDLFAITDVATTYGNDGVAAPTVRGLRSDEPDSLGDYPESLRRAQRSITGLLSMIPESPGLASVAVHRALTSGDRFLTDEARGAVLASAGFAVVSVTDEIVMTPEQIVTLTSGSGKVPLNIENRLQVPARVHVSLRSAKLDFPDGAEFDQVLAPGTTTRIDARVTTRASGAFPLEVIVTSADTVTPVTQARFTVRSTAISGIGLIISIGAGLFLMLWWLRHYRTARRASRLMESERSSGSAGSSPPDAAGYAPSTEQTMGEQ
jgi:hypothetical protein